MQGSLLRAIRRSVAVGVAVGSVALAAPATVSAQLVTFDNLSPITGCTIGTAVPTVYAGFNWSNFAVYTVAAFTAPCLSLPGYVSGVLSGSNAVFSYALPATISSASPFTFTSGFFGDPYQDGQLTLTGSLNGTTVFTQVVDLVYAQPKVLTINSGSINSLSFSMNTGFFTADNLTFNANPVTTPEPSSMALLGTGLVGLVPIVRRRRRRSQAS